VRDLEVNVPRSLYVIIVSAESKTALTSRLVEIQSYLERKPHMVHDLAYTLGARRDHLSHRAYLICDAKGSISEIQSSGSAINPDPSVVFTFTGQGAQWAGMGRELMENFATFHQDIQTMDRVLQEIEAPPKWSIEGIQCPSRQHLVLG
jgi:acyl transferase domain-containing protein